MTGAGELLAYYVEEVLSQLNGLWNENDHIPPANPVHCDPSQYRTSGMQSYDRLAAGGPLVETRFGGVPLQRRNQGLGTVGGTAAVRTAMAKISQL